MNVLDSQLVAALLREMGLRRVESPREADIVLFNTCSVRQHAEDKVLSRLGALRRQAAAAGRRSSGLSAAWPRRTGSRSSAAPRTWTWS